MTVEASLLGIAGYMERARIEALITALRTAWTITMEKPPADLERDLEDSRRWFDPVAQGQRLRRELALLAPLPKGLADPGPPLSFNLGARRWLITPEGRSALDLLEHLSMDAPGQTIRDEQLIPYERRLAVLYQQWSRHRLTSVVSLLAGTTKPLQIPAAGVVVALLVNRCTSEQRALRRSASGAVGDVVDRAFFAPVQAFAEILAPSKRRGGASARLVSGWMLYEARRRLGEDLVLVDARGGEDGKVWIRAEAVGHVVDIVARDLARGHRIRATAECFAKAFDALVSELHHELPTLAGFGLAHERPLDTARLRDSLIERMRFHLAASS